ncbi:DUF6461 domain-containing protein [Streptosporangium sp. NPDC020145]|uniref:DUF6461 domain-containing protein n=1 Tax=Streptosporangium sp. NPDC020145 TaxID=3154694 RepID=UPI003448C4F0
MRSRTYLHDLLASTLFTEDLDSDTDLWALGFTAIWVKGAGLDTLARAFSLDLTTRAPCHLSEILDHAIADGSCWVAEVNDWIGIVPAVADDEVLRSVTEGGHQAIGFSMDINHNACFGYARDGRIIVSFDPTSPEDRYGENPYALDRLTDGLRFQIDTEAENPDDLVEVEESISSALALIGRVTETDMAADWFQAWHSRIGRSQEPRVPGNRAEIP